MFNRTAIMRDAHAKVRTIKARGKALHSYANLFQLHLRLVWQNAKVEVATVARKILEATNPAAVRIADLADQIFAEECRPRLNFALVQKPAG